MEGLGFVPTEKLARLEASPPNDLKERGDVPCNSRSVC